jgi:hypothetical protein
MTTIWTLLCLAGVWGFALCTLGLILRSFPAQGVLDQKCALKWGAAVLVSFIVWMIGMANA